METISRRPLHNILILDLRLDAVLDLGPPGGKSVDHSGAAAEGEAHLYDELAEALAISIIA